MKKYTLTVVKTKKSFMFETKKDLDLLEKVLKSTWGKKKFKLMCEFYDSMSEGPSALDEALAKAFPDK